MSSWSWPTPEKKRSSTANQVLMPPTSNGPKCCHRLTSSKDTAPPSDAIATPGRRTVEEVTSFLKITHPTGQDPALSTGSETVAVLIRGDHDVNEIKFKRLLGVTDLELADPATVQKVTGAPLGFAGPVGLKLRIVADHAIKARTNVVVGGNQPDTHLIDVNCRARFHVEQFADLRNAQAGDPSPRKRRRPEDDQRDRGRPRVHARHQIQPEHECHRSSIPTGRNAWPSWVLRDRRRPNGRCGGRAES